MPDTTLNYGFRIPKADGTDLIVPDDVRVPVTSIDAQIKANADSGTSSIGGLQTQINTNATNIGKAPLGVVQYAQATANTSLNFFNVTDLPGLSVTHTFDTLRKYKIVIDIHLMSTVANDRAIVYLRESGNAVQHQWYPGAVDAVNVGSLIHAEHYYNTGYAGSKTLKVSAGRAAGTGGWDLWANALYPAYIAIEDLGIYP